MKNMVKLSIVALGLGLLVGCGSGSSSVGGSTPISGNASTGGNGTNIACDDEWAYFAGYEPLADVNATPQHRVVYYGAGGGSSASGGATRIISATLIDKYSSIGQTSLFNVNRLCETKSGIKLAFIPKGTFEMGTGEYEYTDGYNLSNEKPRHNVTITKDYYVGIHKVTQAEWGIVVEASAFTDLNATPSCNYNQNATFDSIDGEGNAIYGNKGCTYANTVFVNGTLKDTSAYPVDSVNWTDTQKFIDALNILEPDITIDGHKYKYALPTEAQWERAIRADGNTSWYWGRDWCGDSGWNECDFEKTFEYAWFSPALRWMWYATQYFPDSVVRTQPVGQKPASAYGLYDMGSNFIPEWLQDYYDDTFYSKPEALFDDPVNDTYKTNSSCGGGKGDQRVIRGGTSGRNLRSAYRNLQCENNVPTSGSHGSNVRVGFRLALVRAD